MRAYTTVLIIGCLVVPAAVAQVEWRLLETAGERPDPRRGVAGLFEPESGQLLFQGGETATARFRDDLWRFDPVTLRWAKVETIGLPQRCHHTLVLDDTRQRGLMFGGFPRTNQLLEWNVLDGQWRDVTPPVSPPARCLHSSVIDRPRERMIVYGGLNGNFLPDLSDTWALDLVSGQWTQLVESDGPGERYGHVAAIDTDRDRMIVFGGLVRDPITGMANETNDLWAFDLAANDWSPLEAGGPKPARRQFAAGAVLPGRGSLILFGGRSGNDFFDDTWLLDFQSLQWRRLATVGATPQRRFRHTLVADAVGERLWMAFGEGGQGLHFEDVWELDIRTLLGDDPSITDGFTINAAISDAWFFPDTSGQGFFIIVWEDSDLVFLAWFTYDTERPPQDVTAILGEPGHRWLTALGPYDGDTALLDVFSSSGMIFDSGDLPVNTEQLEGATIEIIWSGCNAGVVKYDIPSLGLSGETPIERITMDNVPACMAAQPE